MLKTHMTDMGFSRRDIEHTPGSQQGNPARNNGALWKTKLVRFIE